MRTTGSIVYAHLTWQKIASLVRGRSLLLLSMLVVPRGVQWGGGEGEYGRDGSMLLKLQRQYRVDGTYPELDDGNL